jgi:hypothetical protein
MGLNGFSEVSLRDYLYAVLAELDGPDPLDKYVAVIAKEAHSIKGVHRRKGEKVTHEKMLATILLKCYDYGKVDGTKAVCEVLTKSVRKAKLKDEK